MSLNLYGQRVLPRGWGQGGGVGPAPKPLSLPHHLLVLFSAVQTREGLHPRALRGAGSRRAAQPGGAAGAIPQSREDPQHPRPVQVCTRAAPVLTAC